MEKKNSTHAEVKIRYKTIARDVTDILHKNFLIIYDGKNGTGVFISSGYVNNFWQEEEVEIPFGAPIILFALNGNPNTPVLCCMQYEPDILIISRLTGRLRNIHDTKEGCITCIQNPLAISVKRFIARKDVKAFLMERLMGAQAATFRREIKKIFTQDFMEGIVDNAVHDESLEIIDKLQEKKYPLLQILSTNTATEICYAKDVFPGTPIEYVEITYHEDNDAVKYTAGFIGKENIEGEKQMYFREPIVSFLGPFTPEDFSNIIDTWIITEKNTRWLKEINVDYMTSIIMQTQKKIFQKTGSYSCTGIRIIRKRKQKVLVCRKIRNQQKGNIIKRAISAIKKLRYERIKSKRCVSCVVSTGNTIDIYI